MNAAPNSLREFQLEFGRYLRAPRQQKRPSGLPARRVEIYEELLFNNVSGFIHRCFPVSKSLMTAKNWQRLIRVFYRDWRCRSPLFSEIPREFVEFIANSNLAIHIPKWMPELMHYEWMELAVDTCEKVEDAAPVSEVNGPFVYANNTLRILSYQWPVHRISSEYRPRKPQVTHILVYRNSSFSVKFLEVNAMSALLVQKFSSDPNVPATVLSDLAKEIQHPSPESFVQFGLQLVQDYLHKEILFIGEYK
jgi:hypothetical protein